MFSEVAIVCCTLLFINVVNGKFDGGRVTDDTTLTEVESPFNIKYDILVEKDATLRVEPGVTMKFAPQILLAVNGTFYAKVSNLVLTNVLQLLNCKLPGIKLQTSVGC